MTQSTFSQQREADDIEHYGVKGMRWGKSGGKSGGGGPRTAGGQARQERNANIMTARVNQSKKASEIKSLSQQRANTSSAKGKAKLDSMIADKEFALKNSNDAALASQRTSGEKWMKAAKTTALIATSLVVGNTVANIIDQEVFKPDSLAGKSLDDINARAVEKGEMNINEYYERHSQNVNNKNVVDFTKG